METQCAKVIFSAFWVIWALTLPSCIASCLPARKELALRRLLRVVRHFTSLPGAMTAIPTPQSAASFRTCDKTRWLMWRWKRSSLAPYLGTGIKQPMMKVTKVTKVFSQFIIVISMTWEITITTKLTKKNKDNAGWCMRIPTIAATVWYIVGTQETTITLRRRQCLWMWAIAWNQGEVFQVAKTFPKHHKVSLISTDPCSLAPPTESPLLCPWNASKWRKQKQSLYDLYVGPAWSSSDMVLHSNVCV